MTKVGEGGEVEVEVELVGLILEPKHGVVVHHALEIGVVVLLLVLLEDGIASTNTPYTAAAVVGVGWI